MTHGSWAPDGGLLTAWSLDLVGEVLCLTSSFSGAPGIETAASQRSGFCV